MEYLYSTSYPTPLTTISSKMAIPQGPVVYSRARNRDRFLARELSDSLLDTLSHLLSEARVTNLNLNEMTGSELSPEDIEDNEE